MDEVKMEQYIQNGKLRKWRWKGSETFNQVRAERVSKSNKIKSENAV